MHRHLACAAFVLAAAAAPAGAQSIAVKGGTTGIGAELGYGLSPMFGLRANLMGGSLSRDEEDSGVRYDGKVKMNSGALLLDLHPFSGTFRLSAGLVYDNNKFDGTAVPVSGTVEINGVPYPAAAVGDLRAAVRFEKTAPYLGLGWGSSPKSSGGFFFSVDIGAFLSKPSATLTGNCGPALVGTAACDQLQADIRAEQAELQDSLDDIKAWPVLTLGIGYRF